MGGTEITTEENTQIVLISEPWKKNKRLFVKMLLYKNNLMNWER